LYTGARSDQARPDKRTLSTIAAISQWRWRDPWHGDSTEEASMEALIKYLLKAETRSRMVIVSLLLLLLPSTLLLYLARPSLVTTVGFPTLLILAAAMTLPLLVVAWMGVSIASTASETYEAAKRGETSPLPSDADVGIAWLALATIVTH